MIKEIYDTVCIFPIRNETDVLGYVAMRKGCLYIYWLSSVQKKVINDIL